MPSVSSIAHSHERTAPLSRSGGASSARPARCGSSPEPSPTGRGLPKLGFSFGKVAETYHLGRPYSPTLNQAQQVLEIGAALAPEEREGLLARVRPLLAGPYRLPLPHELAWTRVSR
jgi:hypothetical protein